LPNLRLKRDDTGPGYRGYALTAYCQTEAQISIGIEDKGIASSFEPWIGGVKILAFIAVRPQISTATWPDINLMLKRLGERDVINV
jgi:hypothetical protein